MATDKADEGGTNNFAVPTKGGDEALLAWLKRKQELGKLRIPDLQMRLQMAFVLGHQWAIWDKTQGKFQQPKNRSNDPNPPVRITANKIGSIVERSIAKLTKQAPMPAARPISDGNDDADAARVATRIIEHELDRMKWEAMLTRFYFWPVTLGYSFLHVYWDPDAGPEVGKLNEVGKLAQPGEDARSVKQGNVCIDIVPAFELSVDPNAHDSMEEALWCLRTTSWSREAVWDKWGVNPEAPEYGRSLADDVYALATNGEGVTGTYQSKNNSDYVYVHQFWMKPCRAAPQGLVVTWCGSTILEKKEKFPYEHGRLPFIQFDLLPGLGTREGRTWVTDLIPLQIDYNDARSREATIRRLLAPKILAPTGSIDPQRVTARVEVITYAPTGEKPTMMIPDSGWTQQFEEGMLRADQEMGDRAGQSDASAGRAHASQPAASILALQEADETKLAISEKQLNAGIERVGWQLLRLVKQFWSEDRTVRTWSDADGMVEMYHYSKANLSDELDVHIAGESGVPRSQAARAQLALDLHSRGIPPFTDPQVLMKFIDIPGADIVMDALNVDTRQAHRENGWLLMGHPVEIHLFDKHFVHIMEHADEMKSIDYEQAPPEIKANFDGHYAAHMEQIQTMFQNGDIVGLTTAGFPIGGGAGGSGVRENINFKDVSPEAQSQMLTKGGIMLPKGASPAADSGIGGPGQPGHVPGQTTESQQAHGATARK